MRFTPRKKPGNIYFQSMIAGRGGRRWRPGPGGSGTAGHGRRRTLWVGGIKVQCLLTAYPQLRPLNLSRDMFTLNSLLCQGPTICHWPVVTSFLWLPAIGGNVIQTTGYWRSRHSGRRREALVYKILPKGSPYVFCRNWAVRNPAGTRLDSNLVNKIIRE